jgi:hypothetical protein
MREILSPFGASMVLGNLQWPQVVYAIPVR